MQDNLIALTIMLFILSLVTERISTFVKLSLQEVWIFKWIGNMREETDNKEDEKKREGKIVITSIIIGFLVALIFKLDIFFMFSELSNNQPGNSHLFKQQFFGAGWGILTSIAGYFITGCFLSFGSKFWHDLVDILLQIKNVKKSLANQQTYQVDNADEVVQKLSHTDRAIALEALKKYDDLLQSIPGVGEPSIDYRAIKGESQYCVIVPITDAADPTQVPSTLRVVFEDGSEYNIPVITQNI